MIRFLRDKAAVFFSLLSVIIMLALYFLFLGKQYTSHEVFNTVDEGLKTYLTISIIMGGVLVINTLSLSFGMMGNLITDGSTQILKGFLVTPIARMKIIASYYIAGIINTFLFSLVMWIITLVYIALATPYMFSFLVIIKVIGLLFAYSLISTAFMLFVTTIIKTAAAFFDSCWCPRNHHWVY